MHKAVATAVATAIAVASAIQLGLACWLFLDPGSQDAGSIQLLLRQSCHQEPERCFTIWERSFPLCARCVGILIGAMALAAFSALRGMRFRLRTVGVAVALLAIGAGHWYLGCSWNLQSSNAIRLLVGFLCGMAVSVLAVETVPAVWQWLITTVQSTVTGRVPPCRSVVAGMARSFPRK